MSSARRRGGGFTLIELAMVLFVVALVLGGLLMPLSVRVDQSRRAATAQTLADVREALYGFAVANGRLPCPDVDGDGAGDPDVRTLAATETCPTAGGLLPAADLAVEGTDAWGRRLGYRVSTPFTARFTLATGGDITVRSAASGGQVLADEAVALVISFGGNGGTTPSSADELENWGGSGTAPDLAADAVFVSHAYVGDPASFFDDQLVWLSPHVLRNRMVVAGQLP